MPRPASIGVTVPTAHEHWVPRGVVAAARITANGPEAWITTVCDQ